jgi:tRNA pseudouridine55 synthase
LQQDGILLIDKPAGWTSHDVVARSRKLLGTRRVGHTGTLDPFATGLLVVCVNKGTRLVQFLTGEDKEYLATARFGFATNTGDLTGIPLTSPVSVARLSVGALDEAAAGLRGRIRQIPPMYSAKKVAGVRLHDLARRGEEVERQPIEIEIKAFEILEEEKSNDSHTRDFRLRIVCSSGTYIRTLAEDLGKRLGIGAHLAALQRTRVGPFTLEQAVPLQRLAELALAKQTEQVLLPLRIALAIPEIVVDVNQQCALAHGQAIPHPHYLPLALADGAKVKFCNQQGDLLAIASFNEQTQAWQPRVVLCEQPG